MSAEIWTVERHLHTVPPPIGDLYRRFISLVEACGPFVYSVSKTAITLKGERRGFAGAKPKTQWLDGYLDLQRPFGTSEFAVVSPYTKKLFVHQFRISDLRQLDPTFAQWISEAYEVGAGSHLRDK